MGKHKETTSAHIAMREERYYRLSVAALMGWSCKVRFHSGMYMNGHVFRDEKFMFDRSESIFRDTFQIKRPRRPGRRFVAEDIDTITCKELENLISSPLYKLKKTVKG